MFFGKLAVLACFAISITSVVFAGGRTSGGGDPFRIAANPFPNPDSLELAINIIIQKVEKSRYPQDFNHSILLELSQLHDDKRFLTLPMLIILAPGTGPDTYKVPEDYHNFTALGAMTSMEPGSPIYFSEKAAQSAPDDLALLLIHEILHHLLPLEASRDEKFVQEVAKSIINEEHSVVLDFGIRHGVVFRDNSISGAGLYRELLRRALIEISEKTGFFNTGRELVAWSPKEALKISEQMDLPSSVKTESPDICRIAQAVGWSVYAVTIPRAGRSLWCPDCVIDKAASNAIDGIQQMASEFNSEIPKRLRSSKKRDQLAISCRRDRNLIVPIVPLFH